MSRTKAERRSKDAYRCDACRQKKNRCDSCRAARAKAVRDRHDAKREAGICLRCAERAAEGATLCDAHLAENNARSQRSHTKARRAAGVPKMPKAAYARRYGT